LSARRFASIATRLVFLLSEGNSVKPFSAKLQANNLIGVGLRHPHYSKALSNLPINQNIDFVEVHAENFFAKGGITLALLHDIADKYAVSIHGTSLGLGSHLAVPADTLEKFAKVVEISQASWVSEHLCFNRARVNEQIVHSGDLLPLAYNRASLDILSSNIDHVQNTLKRPILIENLSAYLSVSALDESELDEMSEVEFLIALCKQSGCGLLLDINNLIVNALNQKQANVLEHVYASIKQIPSHLIGEIHLAGFSDKRVNGFIVDDHASAVSQQCWALYEQAKGLFGKVPTLIEWDNDLPEWEVLVGEALKARG
jgi:uncharacterized protein (UPF0276 family)